MDTNEYDEQDLFIVDFSQNIHNITDEQDNNSDSSDNVEEIQNEENVSGRGGNRGRGRDRGRGRGRARNSSSERDNREQAVQLPPPPFFDNFQHTKPLHKFTVNLPNDFLSLSPYSIFSLFFSLEQIEIIVKNTNKYAYMKDAGEGRKWKELTIKEFRIWLAILIYAGVFKLPSIRDYWNRDNKFPEHKITTFMSLVCFEQIKRFMHISDCTVQPPFWYSKVDPLATHIQTISKSICMPSSNISVDEIIVRFSGRSTHTVRIKNKPTPEGYKILSLCDAGYTYSFIFTSRIQNQPEVQQVPDLSKVDRKLDWDTLSGVVVDNVLAILWMDNGPVTMLSTIHQIDNGNENRIERIRHRPRETSTNAVKVRAVFGTASKKSLPIPVVIDDYNHFMGGVDIADQLRGYYGTQLPDFRIQLLWDLIKEDLEGSDKKPHTRNQVDELTKQFKFIYVDPTKKQQYVTAKFELPIERLLLEGHFPEWRETRSSCIWCKYLAKKNQEKAIKNPPQSQLYCIKCNLALCCNKERSNCFKDFHTYKEDDE
ncbi:unnamed protein product [Rhizophagus irregularis]|uniref:PiggyBac transposable element-derived protein domain-containing protein n=1 Tax=Rhizophagus irregularis TaxID=588596 RepID=A0A915YV09_9GLOM|nr:unnamed protein product [Rhizophagus irregularis]